MTEMPVLRSKSSVAYKLFMPRLKKGDVQHCFGGNGQSNNAQRILCDTARVSLFAKLL
jgi:hypothetical protein